MDPPASLLADVEALLARGPGARLGIQVGAASPPTPPPTKTDVAEVKAGLVDRISTLQSVSSDRPVSGWIVKLVWL
jgi:hypothetical protein